MAETYRSTKQSHTATGYDRVPPPSKHTEKNRRTAAKLESKNRFYRRSRGRDFRFRIQFEHGWNWLRSVKLLLLLSLRLQSVIIKRQARLSARLNEISKSRRKIRTKTLRNGAVRRRTKPPVKPAKRSRRKNRRPQKTVENKVLKNIRQASTTKRIQRRPNMVQETRVSVARFRRMNRTTTGKKKVSDRLNEWMIYAQWRVRVFSARYRYTSRFATDFILYIFSNLYRSKCIKIYV